MTTNNTLAERGGAGSVYGQRSMVPVDPRSRGRCGCGCRTRATHYGLGDGIGLMMGCEFYVRRWVRDGVAVYRTRGGTGEEG